EDVFECAARHFGGDHVSAIGGLLEVDAHPVVDGRRSVGGDNDGIGGDGGGAVVDLGAGRLVGFLIGALDIFDAAAGVDLHAALVEGAGEAVEKLERVEAGLVG